MTRPSLLSLRTRALQILAEPQAQKKCQALAAIREDARALSAETAIQNGALDAALTRCTNIPGRPSQPQLVAPSAVPRRSLHTVAGRAALIHALAHIELNAINLALDIVWRFANLPAQFYLDWMQVAAEEAQHFQLLEAHLHTLGYAYGDFPAHNGLWEMAERTQDNVLARLALVPRVLEARGLDVTPTIRAKLAHAGDAAGAAILDIILRDEIGHVALGNHWFKYLCHAHGLNPVQHALDLAQQYRAPPTKGPFNLVARLQAGFTAEELANLAGSTLAQ